MPPRNPPTRPGFQRSLPRGDAVATDVEHLIHRLQQLVIERFDRLTGLVVVTAPIDPPGPRAELPAAPSHPECGNLGRSNYCRRKWKQLVGQLRSMPEVHCERCEFGMLCAVVPVAWNHRCLAVCQLVAPAASGEPAFERHVELLDVLVENFLAREVGFLERLETNPAPPPSSVHPSVQRALDYIDANLSSSGLTVAGIARHLDVNPSYLAHLFSRTMGQRMSRHIARKRIDLARGLLTDTDWQIKRIARASGHANPDWFSHLFHLHIGVTPTQYRTGSRPR